METLDITIREAIPTDAADIIEIMRSLNQETPFLVVNHHLFELTTQQLEQELHQIYESDTHTIFLAFNHLELIGLITLSSDSDPAFSHVGEVGISIKQDFWGMGLGTVLFETLIDWVEYAQKTKRLEINVQERNTRAIHLYQKVGFNIEGIKQNAMRDEQGQLINIVLMSYLLP